ncbi:MAG: ATP-binding protein [Acidobacteria bacterium]|nr:ATP-binding protein [Acidobacteriota bacterium]
MDRARYLEPLVAADLPSRMVFVAGPRQVGKTTLARHVLATRTMGTYLNWDQQDDRREIRAARWPGGRSLVVLDEIHKWRGWKRWLKGEFDKHRGKLEFLVTGSARLDVYRRGGDSLQGRYHHYRLHPFSCGEALGARLRLPPPGGELPIAGPRGADAVRALMEFGGFPEPFLAQSARTARRWRKERLDRFLREDVRDLEMIREISPIQHLAEMIPMRVGSPLSINSLREDLDASHRGVAHWLDVLERLYHLFVVRPYTHRRLRGLKKMPKIYLWDWTLVDSPPARFENMIASHLLKFCHLLEDAEGLRCELTYLRDRAGHEVDFLVTLDAKPWFAVEAKLDQRAPDESLRFFGERLAIPWRYQVSLEGGRDFVQSGARCLTADRLLPGLV